MLVHVMSRICFEAGEIDQNQTRYWEKMQYADLAHAAQHGGPVKLTVM